MFMGDENLRGAGEKILMTPEQMEILVKCSQDIFEFVKYFYICTPKGFEPMPLRDYQERMIRGLMCEIPEKPHRIVMVGRQAGKTTIATLILTWWALFNKDKSIFMLAQVKGQALEALSRIRDAYQKLPMWMQQGVVKWSSDTIELENGCKLRASANVRGKTIDYLFIDEYAHIPNKEAEAFNSSTLPALASRPDARMIIVSTPLGMNHFYDMWQKSINNQNNILPIKIQWYDIPGRDEAWKKQMIALTSEKQFAQEFECLDGDTEVEVCDDNGFEKKMSLKELYELEMIQNI